MIYPVFAIKDCKTEFMQPMVDQNESAAIRNFEHSIKVTAGIMHSHPADFELYKIADFNTENGMITGIQPEFIISGSEVQIDV